ncbi:MAG: hypothetical protein WC797_03035 [Candidatus Paceibacterota bacterium]
MKGLLSAAGVFVYVALISLFFSNTKDMFGSVPTPNMLIPMMMLLLFVFSAAVTGLLVFGGPVYLFLDNRKGEAVKLLSSTLFFLLVLVLLVILALLGI